MMNSVCVRAFSLSTGTIAMAATMATRARTPRALSSIRSQSRSRSSSSGPRSSSSYRYRYAYRCSSSPPFLSQLLSSMKEEVDPGVVEGTHLRIVKYPHPALRRANDEITVEELKDPSNHEINDLAKGMLKIMYAAEGVGLAAPQVGVNKRLMVYNPTGDQQKWLEETILVNPKIVEYSEAQDVETEGCLSFPDMSGDVTRSKWIKVQALTLKGKPVKKKFTGWEARIFQHEYDHLDGKVYIDRLTEEGREQVQPRLNELIEEFGDGGEL